jgi:DNA-binding NarL/FixJ family response regulator
VNLPEKALRVLIADDHHFFRVGLRGMLESAGVSVVGEASDGAEAVAQTAQLKPDLVVIDLNMPDGAGAEALRRIATESPEARVVVLSASGGEIEVVEALRAGACSFILKDTQADELVGGIRHSAGSQAVLSRELVRALVKGASPTSQPVGRTQPATGLPALTTREMDVLRLLVRGEDNAAIGLELSISRHTVKQHVTNIFEKLEVNTRVQAAVYAVRTGLV